MFPAAHCVAATALLLLCASSSAFVRPACRRHHGHGHGVLAPTATPPMSSRSSTAPKTEKTIATATATATARTACTTRPRARRGLRATRLASKQAVDGAGGGDGGGGPVDDEAATTRTTGKTPRSVGLPRPWDVEVDFHGERRFITVQPGDSILEAAEMSGMNLSYECRRGNCTSCAARVQDGSSQHFENWADRRPEDGAPEGFVLTCSTHPTGPGVKLELSANAAHWEAYCARMDDISTQALLRKTSAGLMRKYRMEHPEFFREEMERQFNESKP